MAISKRNIPITPKTTRKKLNPRTSPKPQSKKIRLLLKLRFLNICLLSLSRPKQIMLITPSLVPIIVTQVNTSRLILQLCNNLTDLSQINLPLSTGLFFNRMDKMDRTTQARSRVQIRMIALPVTPQCNLRIRNLFLKRVNNSLAASLKTIQPTLSENKKKFATDLPKHAPSATNQDRPIPIRKSPVIVKKQNVLSYTVTALDLTKLVKVATVRDATTFKSMLKKETMLF